MATRSIPFRDVVTFSAEHPTHRVRNLLLGGVLGGLGSAGNSNSGGAACGKWTAPKYHPEESIEVELSFPPCFIRSLDVGNHWTATMEIEVGRSSEPVSKREPLLRSPASLMSRIDCQIGSNKDAMRFFTADDDFSPTAARRWVDRIRIVCHQPFRRDVLYGLATLAIRGVALDDLNREDRERELGGLSSTSPHFLSKSFTLPPPPKSNDDDEDDDDEDEEHEEGIKGLIAKAAKNQAKKKTNNNSLKAKKGVNNNKAGASPKAAAAAAAKPQPLTEIEQFRNKAVTFMKNIDPSFEFGSKELVRIWTAENGNPKSAEEKSALKAVAKGHAFGKPLPIIKEKLDTKGAADSKRPASAGTKAKQPRSPASSGGAGDGLSDDAASSPSVANKKFVFKKKAAAQAAHAQAQAAAAAAAASAATATTSSTSVSSGIESPETNGGGLGSPATFGFDDKDSPSISLLTASVVKKQQQGRRKTKTKSIEELLGSGQKSLADKFDALLQSQPKSSPSSTGASAAKKKTPLKLNQIRSKYDNVQAVVSSPEPERFKSDIKKFKVPKDYLVYSDDQVRDFGILVQVRQYKKDKYLPLVDGSEVKVDKGTFVTFFKNSHHIHMKINEQMFIPDVEPEHVAGIFKDYTENEIEESDRHCSLSSQPTKSPASSSKKPTTTTASNNNSNNSDVHGNSVGGGKKGPQAETKTVVDATTSKAAATAKGKRSLQPGRSSSPAAGSQRSSSPDTSGSGDDDETDGSPAPGASKKQKLGPAKQKSTTTSSKRGKNAASEASPQTKTPRTSAAKKAAAAAAANATPTTNTTTPTNNKRSVGSAGKGSSAGKASGSSRSGGSCPLCNKAFSRTRDLMEHCSSCEGPAASSVSGSSSSPSVSVARSSSSNSFSGKSKSVPMADCPICSKKMAQKDIERHARLCAENMFG